MRYAHFAPSHASRSILEAQRSKRRALAAGDKRATAKGPRRDHQHFRSCKSIRINARDGGRTRTPLAGLRILSPVRLPVPPPRRIENQRLDPTPPMAKRAIFKILPDTELLILERIPEQMPQS